MRRLAWMLFAIPGLTAQEPKEARVPFHGTELLYLYTEQEPASKPLPLLVLLQGNAAGDLEDARSFYKLWQPAALERGWRLIVPWTRSTAPAWTDVGVKALEAVVEDFKSRFTVDATRVYLAGLGDGASQVFYVASRMADLWAAALAIEGTPKIAIDSNRLFAANTGLMPVMWAVRPDGQADAQPLRKELMSAGFNLRFRASADLTIGQALDWLAGHSLEPHPRKIDCETGNTAFPRCYWIEMTRFDPSLRNDVLTSTRVQPGAGGYLGLGGFGFNAAAPGPGVVVAWLPEDYKGPLKLGDRIVAVGGREIPDARGYLKMMDEVSEEKAVGVMIERAGKRQRLETRILLPKREEVLTARVQAEFLPDFDEIQVLSRGVEEMRVQVPTAFAPCKITWNGAEAAKAESAGCWILAVGSPARPCSP